MLIWGLFLQPVLMIFGKPVSLRVGMSRTNSVERLEGNFCLIISF